MINEGSKWCKHIKTGKPRICLDCGELQEEHGPISSILNNGAAVRIECENGSVAEDVIVECSNKTWSSGKCTIKGLLTESNLQPLILSTAIYY